MTEEVVIFEAPKIEKPEFRLYYDEKGHVLFYTSEKPEGKYLVIDALTFAECRYDVRVINDQIVKNIRVVIVERLIKDNVGKPCHSDDVSIIVNDDFNDKTYWSIQVNEYG